MEYGIVSGCRAALLGSHCFLESWNHNDSEDLVYVIAHTTNVVATTSKKILYCAIEYKLFVEDGRC